MSSFSLERIRVETPESLIRYSGKAVDYFDILPNSHGLTEEYLYAHQPATNETISVYSTSEIPVGKLDASQETRELFNVLNSPVIVVARKGYAGRLFVVEDGELIVHEDAYAIRPKPQYADQINLWWFAEHYTYEFQANRTSFWGIGDFPRERFNSMNVVIPQIAYQDEVAEFYIRRKDLLSQLRHFQTRTLITMNAIVEKHTTST